jgi:hypothetical protein
MKGMKYITYICKVAESNPSKTVWIKGMGQGVLREHNRGGELVHSTLYAAKEFSQCIPDMILT